MTWSIYANPKQDPLITTFVNYVLDVPGHKASATRVLEAGAGHFYEFFQWSALETITGDYTNADLFIGRMTAKSGALPLWLGIAVVDTDGLKHVPSDLAATAWDNAAMITAFQNFLTHLQGLLAGRELRILFVGNEADNYFNVDPTQIAKFATFLTAARTKARTLFDNAILKVTTTFTFAAIAHWADYAAITAITDLESFTYYFLSGNDFATVDLPAIVVAANGPWVFQELGFTSNISLWASSQAAQNAVLGVVLTLLPLVASFSGANLFTLSDYSTAVLSNAGYTSPFLEFYCETGLRDVNNRPKPAWPAVTKFLGGITGDGTDINTRLAAYLKPQYTSGVDLSSLITRNLAGRTGNMNTRFAAMVQDATP